MDTGYLVLTSGSGGPQLHFALGELERDQLTSGLSEEYRISPIFPVSPEHARLPDLSSEIYIGLFAPANAFQTIGELLAHSGVKSEGQLWFGYGIASLVVFASSADILDVLQQDYSEQLRWAEQWHIRNHLLEVKSQWTANPVSFSRDDFRLEAAKVAADPDIAHIVEEIGHGLNALVPLAAQHAPAYLSMLRRLANEIGVFIDLLSELLHTHSTRTAGEAPVGELAALVHDQKRSNALLDHLVQVNSVLAYAHSQAFGGVLPILQNRSFVHGHSLLGIGTAVLALYALINRVYSAFATVPVYAAVKESYVGTVPLEVFRSMDFIDFAAWHGQKARVDFILEARPPAFREPRPHILFFSGRLGFQEAPYSISAAVQALPFADTVRWSLMILTHEIMHSHVRELLDAILMSSQGDKPLESGFSDDYSRYSDFLVNGRAPADLAESLRFAVYNFCRWRRSLTEGVSDALPPKETLLKLLQYYYRDINEIIVHVLDFRYFYNANVEVYIDALWESWATVPSVLADPSHYVLRSIAVISTTFKGSLETRFTNSHAMLADRIAELKKRYPANALLESVSVMLASPSLRTDLRALSIPNQYLAELAVHCLYSSAVSTLLTDDDRVGVRDDDVLYLLDAGEFPGEAVQSPVALLLDRLKRALARDSGTSRSLTYRSAWLFAACASAQQE